MEDLEAISQRLVRQLYNPLEILTNLVYLIQQDPGDEGKVLEYITMAGTELDRLAKAARTLSFEATRPDRLEFIHSERLDGDLLVVDFSDGTQATYTPEDLVAIGGKRKRSELGLWSETDS
jgi:hypothetical protein